MSMNIMERVTFAKMISKRAGDKVWDRVQAEIAQVHWDAPNNFTVVVVEDINNQCFCGVAKRDPYADKPNQVRGLRIAANRAWDEFIGCKPVYGRHHIKKHKPKTLSVAQQFKKGLLAVENFMFRPQPKGNYAAKKN